MDDGRFDELTPLLATRSRRGAVRLLAGVLLGGPLALFRLDEADAACAKAGKRCGKDKKCCGGTACKGGRCRCKQGAACRGRCCRPGQRCAGGRCVAAVSGCQPEPKEQT